MSEIHAPSRVDGLARAAGLAGAATMASRVLGVVREQVLAAARYVFDLRRSVTGYLLPKDQS